MSNTYNTKDWGKRKRLKGYTTFKTEKMADRRCGSKWDKISKLLALKKVLGKNKIKIN
jgi:hypothetical protein